MASSRLSHRFRLAIMLAIATRTPTVMAQLDGEGTTPSTVSISTSGNEESVGARLRGRETSSSEIQRPTTGSPSEAEHHTGLALTVSTGIFHNELGRRKLFFTAVIAGSAGGIILVGLFVAYRLRSREQITQPALDEDRLSLIREQGNSGGEGAGLESEAAYRLEANESAATDSKELKPQKSSEAERKQLALIQKHQSYVNLRGALMVTLLLLYVGLSLGIPILSQGTITCNGGFLWETHMWFLACFLLTKLAELALYTFDPTVTGELGVISGGETIRGFFCKQEFTQGFLWKFVMSFMGYVDGYQDSIAIAIAFSCPDPFAQQLAWLMLWVYIIGVVLLQWVVVAFMASRDPTHACLAKLLHMDAFGARITVPKEMHRTYKMIQGARTIAEDIPQAILQTFFVIYVRKNLFMVVSICFAVGGSLMGLKDALTRALEATGFHFSKPVKAVHVQSGWAIHGVIFEKEEGVVEGQLMNNDQEVMSLDELVAQWQTDPRHASHSLILDQGEWIEEVRGDNCIKGYLCYALEFDTNLGRRKSFCACSPNHDWRGDPFAYKAKPGYAISAVTFASGKCTGIEEMAAPAQ